jgi:hypothetical protein
LNSGNRPHNFGIGIKYLSGSARPRPAYFTGFGVDFTPPRSASSGPRASAGKVGAGARNRWNGPGGAWWPDWLVKRTLTVSYWRDLAHLHFFKIFPHELNPFGD